MKLKSFRLRIALLSAALAGGALMGFGLVAWRLIYVAKVSSLDAKLDSQLQRMMTARSPEWWQSFAEELPRELDTQVNTPISLLAVDDQGRTLHYSVSEARLGNVTLDMRELLRAAAADIAQKESAQREKSAQKGKSESKEAFQPAELRTELRAKVSAGGSQSNDAEAIANQIVNQSARLQTEQTAEQTAEPIAQQTNTAQPPKPAAAAPASSSSNPTGRNIQVSTSNTATGSWRIGLVTSEAGQGAIAVSLQTIDQDMTVIRNIFLVSIPATLLMIAAGAWVLAGSALSPVRKLTSVIQRVTATGLDQQVPIGSADVEFVELIEVFNQMLTRLERSFRQSSRFSGDAAHELKTPLAILRGELELAMGQAPPGSALQRTLGNLSDEVSRLSTIVRKLLLLSLADAGQMSLRQTAVDIKEILAVLIEDIELLDPDLPVTVELDEDLVVRGDGDLLTQVLQNLINNAIKYNLPEGSANRWLSVVGRRQRNVVQITVSNASRDIPPQERDRIFDRFYRGDLSRNRKREGFGLGLSLSREIARAHRGELHLDHTSKGQTAFTLILPIQEG